MLSHSPLSMGEPLPPEPRVSAPPAAPTPPVLLWLLRLLVVMPLAGVTWVAANLLQNIPMWDEFDTVLKFLLDFRAADSLAGALQEFFAMANEHCVLTSRLVFVLLYELTGKANFVHLAIVGNLFMLATLVVGARGVGGSGGARWLWVAVTTLLVFQLQHHENLFSSYASIDHFQVVLLTTSSLLLVVRPGWRAQLGAGVLAALAVFTLAHGVAVLVAGGILLAVQRRWRPLIAWIVGAIVIVGAFSVLLSTAKLAMAVRWDGAGVQRLFAYWLTMLGGVPALGHPRWSLGAGAALVTVFALLSWRRCWSTQPFLSGLALTAVLGCAFIAYGRSSATDIPPVSSRYMVQSAMAWAAVGVLLVRQIPVVSGRRLAGGVLAAAALAVSVAADLRFYAEAWEFTQRRIDAARQYDERATVDGMKRPIFPKGGVADKVLATAAREDLYHLPVQKSREVIMPEGLELYPIVFYLDKVAMGRNNLHVRGWMLTLREVSLDLQPHLQLVQGDRSYLFRGSVERRPDVARAHPDRLDALRSGFYFVVPQQSLPPGTYNLRVVLIGHRRTYYNETKRTVEIPPRPATQ
ncbi:MAG: DUF2029 domain-containing protein [Opitutaceae bacterium]|nr:DUF2029 domain-containing protein [Opitutaceae bacterium]